MTMANANDSRSAAALPSSESLDVQDRPDKVEETRAKVYRAMSLVRLSQQRMSHYAQAPHDRCDAHTAADLSEALDTAWDFLSDAADDFEDFTERAPVVSLLRRQAGGAS
jgi:hypothetical protein